MAILLNTSNTLIIETPRTGTTWIRRMLEIHNIAHANVLPEAMPCDQRHSPRRCYAGSFSRVVVTVRRVPEWLESFWKISYCLADSLSSRPAIYPPDQVFEHARLFPVHNTFREWMQHLQVDVVRGYWLTMCDGATQCLCQEHLERDLSKLTGIPLIQLETSCRQHVSRDLLLEWPSGVRDVYEDLADELERMHYGISLRHG